jgi:peptidoglycan-associated lipoprotein
MNTKGMLVAVLLVGGVGCATAKKQVQMPIEDTSLAQNSAPATKEAPARADGERSLKTVYFGYNSDAIDSEYTDNMDTLAKTLQADPSAKVLIEGHCDERGGTEFNLALGERRAVTVKKHLVRYGISDKQLNVISYGEERPALTGTGEGVWAKNRRAEFSLED